MEKKLITISEATEMLNVSIDTLRRWDKSGLLKAIRLNPRGHRYYDLEELNTFTKDLFSVAKKWVLNPEPIEPEGQLYCPDNMVFQARLTRLEKELKATTGFEVEFSFLTSVVGEIGNNSFDHNVGSWPDVRGILFGYDLNKKQIVLADRGRGVLQTLQKVRPSLVNDEAALKVAFTEKISGRAPENRGNGLKYVRKVVSDKSKTIFIKLHFQSGAALVTLKNGATDLNIFATTPSFRGCLALLNFEKLS